MLFKQLVVDPLKVVCCGTLMEPVAALFSLDLGLSEFDLSEVIGETLEDIGEGGVDEVGAMMAAQAALGRDDWDRDVGPTAEEMRRDVHENVFLVGSRSVAKMKGIAQKGQVRRKALKHATEAARDSQRALQKIERQRAEMNSVYAQKVAEKRLKAGKNRGTFAARAEVDMIAVSQFMATEHEAAKAEERQMMNDIKQLDRQVGHTTHPVAQPTHSDVALCPGGDYARGWRARLGVNHDLTQAYQ